MKIYTNDLVKGHSDVKVKCLTFGLYTQVSDSGPLGPLVLKILQNWPVHSVTLSDFCGFRPTHQIYLVHPKQYFEGLKQRILHLGKLVLRSS